MIELRPTDAEEGLRLDAWLAGHFPSVPRTAVRRLLETGGVTTPDGHPCAKGERVRKGGCYLLKQVPSVAKVAPNPALPLRTVYEDGAVLALNKPAGMDCQPNAPDETDTLANAVLARFPEVGGVGDGPLTCGILHRIDRDTSGLVLAARTQSVYAALRTQFSAHAVDKRYVALVSGTVRAPGRLEHLLAHNPRCPGRMVDASVWRDAKRPMRAVTSYTPVRTLRVEGRPCTLLDVAIRTGVTHQIRAQLSFAGMPIVGDRRYGGFVPEGFPRHFLHARSAAFLHPESGASMLLEAPLTEDLEALLRRG